MALRQVLVELEKRVMPELVPYGGSGLDHARARS